MVLQLVQQMDWSVLLGLTTLGLSFVMSLGSLVGGMVRSRRKP